MNFYKIAQEYYKTAEQARQTAAEYSKQARGGNKALFNSKAVHWRSVYREHKKIADSFMDKAKKYNQTK